MIPDGVPQRRSRLAPLLAGGAILVLVAVLYWPIRHGGFVWDDTSSLHDQAWLRQDRWLEFVFHGFNGWINYFRPLVVLLFVGELRVFDGQPGPMHLVSLTLHLADTAMVGLLALRLAHSIPAAPARPVAVVALAMLFYGLHPALIEPVGWVGCQFELAAVFFMLLGLLAAASIASQRWRGLAVASSFLLAAGFKESAAAFPLLLILFALITRPRESWRASLQAVWRRERTVLAAVLVAGILYLIVRHIALGYTVLPSSDESMVSLARLQRVCATYLHYWQLVVWPMNAIGPVHPFAPGEFGAISPASLAVDAGAIALLAAGSYAFWRRQLIGGFVLAVSAALLPVVNLLPIALSESLYHDRYATTAIAVASVLLPLLILPLVTHVRVGAASVAAALLLVVWLAFAVINVRVTVPLWADELALWKWAAKQHPDSVDIQQHLLATYIARNDRVPARVLADELVAANAPCPFCMLNAADLALADGDTARARTALARLAGSRLLEHDPRFLRDYVLANGRLLELEHQPAAAETAFRDAITLDDYDPLPRMALAALLAREGRSAEARVAADAALVLFAPDEREPWRRKFEQTLAAEHESRSQ